jgi:hypothetical protein
MRRDGRATAGGRGGGFGGLLWHLSLAGTAPVGDEAELDLMTERVGTVVQVVRRFVWREDGCVAKAPVLLGTGKPLSAIDCSDKTAEAAHGTAAGEFAPT